VIRQALRLPTLDYADSLGEIPAQYRRYCGTLDQPRRFIEDRFSAFFIQRENAGLVSHIHSTAVVFRRALPIPKLSTRQSNIV